MRRPGSALVPLTVASLAWLSAVAGCVGFGRQESQALFPADSLSRAIAGRTPVDTLNLVWEANGWTQGDSTWVYVNSVRFAGADRLVATDLGRSRAYVFDATGHPLRTISLPDVRYPYLLEASGDTLTVFDPESGDVWSGIEQRVSVQTPIGAVGGSNDALDVFVARGRQGVFVKRLGTDGGSRLQRRHPTTGSVEEEIRLPGESWRYRGPLRLWGDTLVSVSAFLPQVHLVRGGAIDTLRLVGFDSPALNKTRLYVLGQRDEPPLLVPALAPCDNRLFVLNARPGWVRVDVFDRSGRLERILVEPNAAPSGMNDIDIDVRATGDGAYLIAVARVEAVYGPLSLTYRPRLTVMRWDAGREAGS